MVTGGAGFIGSHLVEHYQGRAEVRVLDNLETGNWSNLEGLKFQRIQGSILEKPLLDLAMSEVDVVYHLAAFVSAAESMEKHEKCFEVNVAGTLAVLEAAQRAHVKKLVFASSSAVYGDSIAVPKHEEMTPEPKSPYAISKLVGEYYCAMWNREGWVPTVALRFFNVFGERQNPSGAYAAAIPIFLESAEEGRPILIHGDGEQTRDFVYVKDVVQGLAFVGELQDANSVYNVGYGKGMKIKDLASEIKTKMNSKSAIQHIANRPGDIRHSIASPERLTALGWVPEFGLLEGFAQIIKQRKYNV